MHAGSRLDAQAHKVRKQPLKRPAGQSPSGGSSGTPGKIGVSASYRQTEREETDRKGERESARKEGESEKGGTRIC